MTDPLSPVPAAVPEGQQGAQKTSVLSTLTQGLNPTSDTSPILIKPGIQTTEFFTVMLGWVATLIGAIFHKTLDQSNINNFLIVAGPGLSVLYVSFRSLLKARHVPVKVELLKAIQTIENNPDVVATEIQRNVQAASTVVRATGAVK